MAAENIILLTHADQFQQVQLKLSYIDLERSLKNTVLLFGKVILPGSAMLRSELTYNLVVNAKNLLRKGIIVPGLRNEYKSYGTYAENNKQHFADLRAAKEKARFLDDNVANVASFSAAGASEDLENNLISALFYLKLDNQVKISWDNLSGFTRSIKKPGVSDRAPLLAELNKIARPNKIILSATQALYHTLGAYTTSSHPVWPQLYTDAFEKVRTAQQNSAGKINHNKEAVNFLAKYKFVPAIQELKGSDNKKIYHETLTELQNLSFISNEVLDALDWNDIMELSRSRAAVNARKNLFKKSVDSDSIDLKTFLKSEKQLQKRFSKVSGGITLASLVTGGVGCITDPVIASAGLALSVGGLLLTVGEIVKNKVQTRMNSFSLLGEQISRRAFENQTAERLIRL